MTIIPFLKCAGIILLAAFGLSSRQYNTRKIRHDHKALNEGTQSDIDFEFETTKGFQFDNGDYDDPPDDVTLDIVHRLYDTWKGIVPNVVYQVKINCTAMTTTLFNYTITVNGKTLARGQSDAEGGPPKFDWSATTADQQSHKYLTFRLEYSTLGTPETNQFKKRIPILKDCELYLLAADWGRLSSRDLPAVHGSQQQTCVVRFPQRHRARLVVDLTKLNVPCERGRLQVSGRRPVCGKLEDLGESDRHYVLDAGHASAPGSVTSSVGRYAFSLTFRLAASCFDNDVAQQNGTVVFTPGSECRYKVTQPYGYRLRLLINSVPYGHPTDSAASDAAAAAASDRNRTTATTEKPLPIDTLPPTVQQSTATCPGTLFRLTDGAVGWFYCALTDGPKRQMSMVSTTNVVLMESSSVSMHVPTLVVAYRAEPIPEIVSQCPYGSVALKPGQCLTIVNDMLNWEEAEDYCVQNGGHLASVDSHRTQTFIDTVLINSPNYSDNTAYWIGATDMNNEGFFKWTDSSPFTYSNWYQGHIHQSYSGPNSKQPNDDGLSRQDCVELRQVYRPQNRLIKYFNRNSSYTWNDRDCSVKNRFLCQTQQHTPLNDYDPDESNCNVTIKLSTEMRFVSVSSPGFPQPYPNNQDCTISLEAPRGYQIEVEFEELMLENESTCSYDYVELIPGDDDDGPKHCGDKSDVLKLTRFVTKVPKLRIHFVSDYSHSFSGYKARVSAEHVNNECDDARQQMFNGSCYLFASYPEVSWHTARSICNGIKAELASIHNAEEEQFVESLIRESTDSRSAIYWLGGTWDDKTWYWIDNTTETFSAWLPTTDTVNTSPHKDICLAISWLSSPPINLPRGLYWTANVCSAVGGYICKKNQIKFWDYYNNNLNTTMTGTEGVITSLNYPGNYYHNLDYWIHVVGPDRARIVFQFDSINIEPQADCLYDYVTVVETKEAENRTMSLCGYRGNNLEDYVFVTDTNEAFVHFHSDYSVSSSGFHLKWNVVDMSGCPSQTLTASEGQVVSPNYPNFILPSLNCITMILAPVGHRIWIDFTDYNLDEPQTVKLYLSSTADHVTPFKYRNSINDGAFLSEGESVKIEYSTNRLPRGRGFKIAYKTVTHFDEERAIVLRNDTSGYMYRLNYPLPMHFPKLRYKQRLLASIGQNVQLQFNHVVPAQMDAALGRTVCTGQQSATVIEIHDHYAAQNGTWWLLCENVDQLKSVPISITSYLNSMSVVIVYGQKPAADMASVNISVNAKPDAESKKKLITLAKVPESESTPIESCKPNPCVNGGTCVLRKATQTYYCKCYGNYTGTFCSLTFCDLGYCVFGECLLTGKNGFECRCQYGYMGRLCDEKIKPCELNPCKDRGDCVALGDSGYQCRCYAYWTGDQCEKKMLHITYKPLTERMLQEPFWLGLLTVFVVMGILGIIWCAKRHVPEKIEKILSEEAERSRHFTVNASGRMSSVRGELLVPTVKTNGATTSSEGGSSPPPQPKTFLRRLGIRKPSLMSLTSPLQTGRTARTFSLDDLLRPQVPRFSQHRTKQKSVSPSKFRTTIANKSEILQQLISPGLERQASFNDEINLVDKLSTNNIGPNDILLTHSNLSQETSFSNDCSIDEAVQKIEKKVTFARLMNKFQSEIMSSTSSEVDAQTKRVLRRPCPNQGSDSLSSLECTLEHQKQNHLSLNQFQQQAGQKAMSADSILAMFRNFNATMAMTEMGNYLSASTTPSCSSLQDEVAGSEDDSLMSNACHSPNGGKESPTRYRYSNVIQLPVVDMLSSQRNNSNSNLNSLQHPPSILLEVPNYRMDCLSPIHELPTPAPSPSPTPIISRKSAFGCLKDADNRNDQQVSLSLRVPVVQPANQTKQLTIPTLVVQQPTPINSPSMEFPGSPPPHKEKPVNRKMLKDMEKPISLDLPAPPPVITVTCMSDSDTESATTKNGTDSSKNGGGMSYLSPFSMCSRADRIASESNLSSSGYSSGPSRCNSNTRLCPLDCGEEPRRISPLIHAPEIREMDSETTFSENDDEGFDTETPDATGGVPDMSARNKHFRAGQGITELEAASLTNTAATAIATNAATANVKRSSSGGELDSPYIRHQPLPSITVQQYPSTLQLSTDMLHDKSPVSSRSESPLSDKTVFKFSPMFYGRTTDSDSIYDLTSSDCAIKKRIGKKKGRKRRHLGGGGSGGGGGGGGGGMSASLCTTPTTCGSGVFLLDVPGRNDKKKTRSKPNTRRRSRSQQTIVPSSSSSTDSLNDTSKMSHGNRHKHSNDSVKRHFSSENWSDRAKSGEDKRTGKKKTKSNRTRNGKLMFRNKTVSDQGHYESENGDDVSVFASLPSLIFDAGATSTVKKFVPIRTHRFRKRVTASD